MDDAIVLAEVLARRYRFTAVVEEDGGWTIYYPDLPGCMTYADSWDDVSRMAREVFEVWMRSEVERGHPIPAPVVYDGGSFWPQGFDVVQPGEDGARDLTSEQVAGRLGITRARVHQLAREHDLGHRVGNAKLFTEADIERLAHRKTEAGRPRKETTAAAD